MKYKILKLIWYLLFFVKVAMKCMTVIHEILSTFISFHSNSLFQCLNIELLFYIKIKDLKMEFEENVDVSCIASIILFILILLDDII